MTSTASPPAPPASTPPPRNGLNPAWLILIIGLPVLIVLVVVGTVAAAVLLPLAFRTPVNQRFVVAGSSDVRVDVNDASFAFTPSSDGRVHVDVRGSASSTPTVRVRTANGRTVVEGGCPRPGWFTQCSLRLNVALPAGAGLSAVGTNGAITTSGIHGRIDARTTNGLVDVAGAQGDLDLHSTNGAVRLTGATSSNVRVETTNGALDLRFTGPPRSLQARSTNGAISVAVPGTTAYAVSATTTNGGVDTTGIRTDPASGNRIVLRTTNGPVQVVPSAG